LATFCQRLPRFTHVRSHQRCKHGTCSNRSTNRKAGGDHAVTITSLTTSYDDSELLSAFEALLGLTWLPRGSHFLLPRRRFREQVIPRGGQGGCPVVASDSVFSSEQRSIPLSFLGERRAIPSQEISRRCLAETSDALGKKVLHFSCL
jgi:hypothetical protein